MNRQLLFLLCLVLGVFMQARAQGSIAIDATNFPDANFRNYLLAQNYGKDAKLTPEEIKGITDIDVYGEDISSLKGIEYFTALTWLDCGGNQLTSLSLSKNTALVWLHCDDNELTSLDVSKSTALEQLYCHRNQLVSLDVSKNAALTRLHCYDNKLASLDLSKNMALGELWCYDNQLKGNQTEAFVNSLPKVAGGELYFCDLSNAAEGNDIASTQVGKAKAKGWTVFAYKGSDWVEYAGTSGISQLEQAQRGELRTYTLDGRPVEGLPVKPGIYIRGSKKVMVK